MIAPPDESPYYVGIGEDLFGIVLGCSYLHTRYEISSATVMPYLACQVLANGSMHFCAAQLEAVLGRLLWPNGVHRQ